jgi:hypothetical protein
MAKQPSIYYTKRGFIRDRKTMRGTYYGSHFKNIIKTRAMAFSRIRTGFLIKMNYFGKQRKINKDAIYLVIEPDYIPKQFMRGGRKPKYRYMHVFDLSFVPPDQVRRLVQFTQEVGISHFIFSNSSFSFLDFTFKNRALYDSLLPIMRQSYRTLIREKLHIRSTEIIDYDFKDKKNAVKVVFMRPNISSSPVKLQFKNISAELGIKIDKLVQESKSGDMVKLQPYMWRSLNRTESWIYEDIDKDAVQKLIPYLTQDVRKYAPIVLNYNSQLYLIYGEKLLQACRVLGIQPVVYLITLQE